MKKTVLFIILILNNSTLFSFIPGMDVAGGLAIPLQSSDIMRPFEIIQLLGAALPINISPYFGIDPELTFHHRYFTYEESGRPVPIDNDHRRLSVLTFFWDTDLRLQIPLGTKAIVGFTVSPSFQFPIVIYMWDEAESDAFYQYFYPSGRFFMPQTGVFFRYNFAEMNSVSISVKVYFPFYHFWTGDGLPFFDNLSIHASIGYRLLF